MTKYILSMLVVQNFENNIKLHIYHLFVVNFIVFHNTMYCTLHSLDETF